MRKPINETTLETLIPEYYETKETVDSLKKTCDELNTAIKTKMEANSQYAVDGYTAKITIQKRESFKEEKLIETLKSLGANDAIKTKEYVDMDVLESMLFNKQFTNEGLELLDKCREVKEVKVLKVTKTEVE